MYVEEDEEKKKLAYYRRLNRIQAISARILRFRFINSRQRKEAQQKGIGLPSYNVITLMTFMAVAVAVAVAV